MMWRDAVNTALTSFKTITRELINATGNKENGIVEKRVEQITNRCGKEVERYTKNSRGSNWTILQNTLLLSKKFWQAKI